MKRKLSIILMCAIAGAMTTLSALAGNGNTPSNGPSQPHTIDALDTVYFDLSQAVIVGTQIEFPVYFLCDDPVFSLDFAFRYNQIDFIYDTILNQTGYIDMLSNYNTNDSTVRLTSYSISQAYDNYTTLMTIKVNMLNGLNFCSGDIFDVTAQLNGDACSFKIIECQPLGINEPEFGSAVSVYPNPAKDHISISAPTPVNVDIIAANGSKVLQQYNKNQTSYEINLHLTKGVYFVRISDDRHVTTKKLVITE